MYMSFVIVFTMFFKYICSTPVCRQKCFTIFWFTHPISVAGVQYIDGIFITLKKHVIHICKIYKQNDTENNIYVCWFGYFSRIFVYIRRLFLRLIIIHLVYYNAGKTLMYISFEKDIFSLRIFFIYVFMHRRDSLYNGIYCGMR